ncbi:MAG: ABC-F family ATP-binding cassette domain-containing protein [Candidatus Dormibacteraeota bacterium]|nr:ABC-F family ATP-binding cassette domain-containing protein [Candidatus Dormibacteraeota bacterium]
MSLINCSGVAVEYGDRVVFSGLDLRVEPGDRIGVVGANGAGKSSFLALLAEEEQPAAGSVDRQGRLIVTHLTQESPEPTAKTVLGEAMASRVDLASLRDEMIHLEHRLQEPSPELEQLLARYGECQAAYEGMGGYELESRARAVLHGLGLEEEEQSRSPRELSVGQVRRMELAKLLLQDADLVLLDEPTNHLDLAAIEWLESHLIQSARTICLVAHDRRLLERVCTKVVELEAGRVEVYDGTYDSYLRQRQERRLRWRRAFEAQQAHISHQEEYIRRYKAGQRARQARGRQTLLDRLERVPEPTELRRMRLSLHAAPSAQVVLRTEGLALGRDAAVLFTAPDLLISRGDRVAILGPNGSGKTTLLHTLVGDLQPVSGRVIPGSRARLRLYRQDFSDLDPDRSVLQTLLDDHPNALVERARSVLGAMLFSGDRAEARVGDLSGGEKARVALARLGMDDANCLLLDEPTNHLDIPAQEVLEQAIGEYPGAVVLVSHDRYFVDSVANRVFEVRDGQLVERRSASPSGPKRAPQRASKDRAPARSLADKQSRRATASPKQAERHVAALEGERQTLTDRLADPATHRNQDLEASLLQRLSQLEQELQSAYAAWVALEGSTER